MLRGVRGQLLLPHSSPVNRGLCWGSGGGLTYLDAGQNGLHGLLGGEDGAELGHLPGGRDAHLRLVVPQQTRVGRDQLAPTRGTVG